MAIFDQYLAISQKPCKMGTQLVWNANRNLYVLCWLVLFPVILSDQNLNLPHVYLAPPLGVTHLEFCWDILYQKTRVPDAIVWRSFTILGIVIVVERWLVTDRQAHHDSSYCASIASCGFVRSFVRYLRAGVQPTSALARGEEGNWIGRCVRYVLAMCRVKEGLNRSEQLVWYFYSVPLLDVAYCLV